MQALREIEKVREIERTREPRPYNRAKERSDRLFLDDIQEINLKEGREIERTAYVLR